MLKVRRLQSLDALDLTQFRRPNYIGPPALRTTLAGACAESNRVTLERLVLKGIRKPASRISVVIPAYNCANYIAQALASVVAQEYEDLEIIVVDDGSTDHTKQVVAEFDAKVTFISQANAGVSVARNTGIEQATGDYVAFLDADDWFYPSKLYKQAQSLDRHPDLGAMHGGWTIVDDVNRSIASVEPWHNSPKLDLEAWLVWKPVHLGAMLFRREWLERVGGFDVDLMQSEDTDLMFRLALEGCRFGWLREATSGYRHHPESTMRCRAVEQADCLERSLDKVYADHRLPNRLRQRESSIRYYSTLWLAWNLFRMGHLAETVPYLLRAARFSPFDSTQTVQDWLAQFVVWSEADGIPRKRVREMWPWFRQATQVDQQNWEAEINRLDACLQVWSSYVEGDRDRGQMQLKRLQYEDFSEVISTIAFYALFTPVLVNVNAARSMWLDAQDLGLAKSSGCHRLTQLYLSIFGRSVRARTPGQAIEAFVAAMKFGYVPKAWGDWSHFIMSAIRYFTPKHLPPSQIPATDVQPNRAAA